MEIINISEENARGSMAMLSFYFLYKEPGLRLAGRNTELPENVEIENNQ